MSPILNADILQYDSASAEDIGSMSVHCSISAALLEALANFSQAVISTSISKDLKMDLWSPAMSLLQKLKKLHSLSLSVPSPFTIYCKVGFNSSCFDLTQNSILRARRQLD